MGVVQALRVRVLGGFEVEGVDTPRLGSRKARILLKVLALARSKPVTIEFLSDCVWPESVPSRPGDQLSVLVSRLRSALGPDVLVRSEAGYSLTVEWLDVDAMAELVDEACRRLAAGNTTAAAVAATAALTLARGPLLPDDDAPWAEADRAASVRVAAAARRIAADAALASGDFVGAALLAQGALDDDGFDEPALRTLMAALAGGGRPATALAAYAKMRARLAEELGVDPTAETEAVHRAVLLGEPVPGPAVDGTGASVNQPRAQRRGAVPPGRHTEVTALDEELHAARAGRGGLVAVMGEAGMGKSYLVDAWTARVASSATVLVGRCNELSRGTPLQAIVDALEEYLRGLDPEAATQALGPESEVLRPFMAPFGGAPTVPASGLRDWGGGQLVAFAAIVAVLARLPAPTVVVLDDVHLAGSATIEWLDYVARRAVALPLLVVATQRPEEAVALPARYDDRARSRSTRRRRPSSWARTERRPWWPEAEGTRSSWSNWPTPSRTRRCRFRSRRRWPPGVRGPGQRRRPLYARRPSSVPMSTSIFSPPCSMHRPPSCSTTLRRVPGVGSSSRPAGSSCFAINWSEKLWPRRRARRAERSPIARQAERWPLALGVTPMPSPTMRGWGATKSWPPTLSWRQPSWPRPAST